MKAIKQKASERLNDPEVTVELKQFQTPYFIVGGQVKTPGKIDFHGHVTVIQAVQLAGASRMGRRQASCCLSGELDDQTAETKLINYRKVLRTTRRTRTSTCRLEICCSSPKRCLREDLPYIKLANLGLYFNPLNP